MGVAHSGGSSARTRPAATDRTEKGPVSFYSVKPAGASSLKRTLAQRETTSGCSKATQTTTLKNAFMSNAPNCSRRVFLIPLKPPVA
jgi:hypothetical protein